MMNYTKFGALMAAVLVALGCAGCVADGTYYGNGYGPAYYGNGYGPGYYGGGYGPNYYGEPGPVVVAGGPVYRETVVVDGNRYRGDRYYGEHRPAPYYKGPRRNGGYYRRGYSTAEQRRTANRRTPARVNRSNNTKTKPYQP